MNAEIVFFLMCVAIGLIGVLARWFIEKHIN